VDVDSKNSIPRSALAKKNKINKFRNFREIIFFKKFNFCTMKKRILENICKIWHLPKGDLPIFYIIRHQGAEPDLGV
jgi:hypothetical protein